VFGGESEATSTDDPIASLWLAQTFLSEPPAGSLIEPRSRCLTEVFDFLAPARHPLAPGEVPRDITLPLFDDVTLHARMFYMDWNFDGSVTWVGFTTEQPAGEVYITFVDGQLSGTVRYKQRAWHIRPDAVCGHVVFEQDNSGPDAYGCGSDEPSEGQTLTAPTGAEEGVPPGMYGATAMATLPPPLQDMPTVDVMWVASPEAEAAAGGRAGLIGFAANRTHEADMTYIRTEFDRTHRVRMVGVENFPFYEPGTWSPAMGGDNPLERAYEVLQTTPGVDARRDELGADVVAALLQTAYNSIAGMSDSDIVAPLVWDPGLSDPFHANNGYLATSYADVVDTHYIFTHEFGHLHRFKHANDHGPQQYVAWRGTFALEDGSLFEHKGLMVDPTTDGCKLLAFERAPPYAWAPNTYNFLWQLGYPPSNPCEDRFEPRAYGHDLLDLGFPEYQPMPSGGVNGVQIGNGTPATHADGTDAYGGDLVFDLADLTPFEDLPGDYHGGAEVLSSWKDPTVIDLDAIEVLDLSPGSLDQIGATGPITLTWQESEFSAFSSPPASCTNPAVCSLEQNPFFLEIGTTYGTANIVSQFIPAENCDAAYDCEVTPTTEAVLTPSGTPATFVNTQFYFGRLWTQVYANIWAYSEFRINSGGRAVGCDAENPEWIPPGLTADACPAGTLTYSSTAPQLPTHSDIHLNLDTTANGGGSVDVISWQAGDPESPYDVLAYGAKDNGLPFCCLMRATTAPILLSLDGTGTVDHIAVGGYARWDDHGGRNSQVRIDAKGGNDVISVNTESSLATLVLAGLGNDRVSTGAETYGEAWGGGHDDTMIAALASPTAPPFTRYMDLKGEGGSDALIATSVDFPAAVRLNGGGARNDLCANRGEVVMVAGSPGQAFAHQLYISSKWGGVPVSGSTGVTTTSVCGAGAYGSGWANPCTYQAPAQKVVPARCIPWISP